MSSGRAGDHRRPEIVVGLHRQGPGDCQHYRQSPGPGLRLAIQRAETPARSRVVRLNGPWNSRRAWMGNLPPLPGRRGHSTFEPSTYRHNAKDPLARGGRGGTLKQVSKSHHRGEGGLGDRVSNLTFPTRRPA